MTAGAHSTASDSAALAAGLSRNLGLWQAVGVVVGGIIGVSIFFVPSAVADSAGHPAIALAIWALAGLLSAGAALSFAELSGAIPETGGTYVHLRRAYRSDLLAFCFAWMMCFGYGAAAIAVVASMAASYLVPLIDQASSVFALRLTAVALIAGIVVINVSSVRRSGLMQSGLMVLKVLIMLMVIILPFTAMMPDTAALRAPLPDVSLGSFMATTVDSLVVCMFAFNGAIFVVQLAGEVRNPEKNVPRAIGLGIAVVFSLYMLVNLAYILFMPFEALRASPRVAADLMGLTLGPSALIIMSVAIVVSALAVLNAQLLGYPRIVFALGRDGLLVSALARIHPRFRTPWVAILLVGTVAALYAASGSYRDILTTVAFVNHLFMTLAVAAVIVLRKREPHLARPFRVWGYPFTPAAFVAVSVVYLVTLLMTKFNFVVIGIVIVLLGIPVYWWRLRRVQGTS